jgi:aldehyde:ferredoxin oxidoreductase
MLIEMPFYGDERLIFHFQSPLQDILLDNSSVGAVSAQLISTGLSLQLSLMLEIFM